MIRTQRHSTATLAQVGTPKVTSCADYFAEVAPWVEVDARIALFEKDQADDLLDGELAKSARRCLDLLASPTPDSRPLSVAGNPDYVIDCIDNIDSKVDLLAYCHQRKIPVFSSLGAAAKSDPSRIQVA